MRTIKNGEVIPDWFMGYNPDGIFFIQFPLWWPFRRMAYVPFKDTWAWGRGKWLVFWINRTCRGARWIPDEKAEQFIEWKGF